MLRVSNTQCVGLNLTCNYAHITTKACGHSNEWWHFKVIIMTNYNSKAITFTLNNVTLNYVHLAQPISPTYDGQVDGSQWSLMATFTDKEQGASIADLGLPVKFDDKTEVFSLNLKQYVTTRQGKLNEVTVVGNDFELIDASKVGFGSTANILAYYYTYNSGGNTGVTARLQGVHVTNLVEPTVETTDAKMKRLFPTK